MTQPPTHDPNPDTREDDYHSPFPEPPQPEQPSSQPDPEKADRRSKRRAEDATSTPVIIKRWDQAVRHPDDVLQHAIEEGEEQANRTSLSLGLSAFAAGGILVFTALIVGIASLLAKDLSNEFLQRLTVALVYPLGFVICIMSATQLFTEHTALAVYPVLEKRVTLPSLLRTWAVVLAGNYLGCLVGAALLLGAEPVIGAAPGYEIIANKILAYDTPATLVSAMLAGWLMAIGGWLVMASTPAVSQMLAIYIVTFIIGLGGLHHSVAAAAELFAALFTGADISAINAIYTLTIVIIGNLIGGSIFVAVLNYGHIRKALEQPNQTRDQ